MSDSAQQFQLLSALLQTQNQTLNGLVTSVGQINATNTTTVTKALDATSEKIDGLAKALTNSIKDIKDYTDPRISAASKPSEPPSPSTDRSADKGAESGEKSGSEDKAAPEKKDESDDEGGTIYLDFDGEEAESGSDSNSPLEDKEEGQSEPTKTRAEKKKPRRRRKTQTA